MTLKTSWKLYPLYMQVYEITSETHNTHITKTVRSRDTVTRYGWSNRKTIDF